MSHSIGDFFGVVLAHPGHELLIHSLIARHKPIVSILTDGAGSTDHSRVDFSRRLLTTLDTERSRVCGVMSDQESYRHILLADAKPFLNVRDILVEEFCENFVKIVISDALEHYNPCHDIACIIADSISLKLQQRSGQAIRRVTIPIKPNIIERQLEHVIEPAMQIELNPQEILRKEQAVAGYLPLADEARRYRQEHSANFQTEILDHRKPKRDLPQQLDFETYYEIWGRKKIADGVYTDLITYQDHVRPICNALLLS